MAEVGELRTVANDRVGIKYQWAGATASNQHTRLPHGREMPLQSYRPATFTTYVVTSPWSSPSQ